MHNELKSKIELFQQLLIELKIEHPDNSGLQKIVDPFGARGKFELLRAEWEKDRHNRDAALALLTEIRILLPLAKTTNPELDYGMLYNLRNMVYKYN